MFRGFILDMDGVVFRGEELIPKADSAIERLREIGRVVFLSNNSTRSREEYAEKIEELGLNIREEEILPATYATAKFVRENYPKARVYAVGALGLLKELLYAGVRLTSKPEKADLLVTGSDPEISYEKFASATQVLLANKPWISTNADKLYPSKRGLIPGTGLVVGALSYITGREPIIVGKPSRHIVDQALKLLDLPREECIIVGDIIESDIRAGKNAGIATALVLSGVTSEDQVKSSKLKPDYVYKDLSEFVNSLEG